MSYIEKTTLNPDALFVGPEIPILTHQYTISAGTALKRGRLLTVAAEGTTATATAKAGVANAVLAYDVDEKATSVTAYVASGDTVEAHEEELRKIGIHMGNVL